MRFDIFQIFSDLKAEQEKASEPSPEPKKDKPLPKEDILPEEKEEELPKELPSEDDNKEE